MGDFRIVIEAAAGHGCQRELKDGSKVFGCRMMHCPDCIAREFVERLQQKFTVSKAELTHWPADMTNSDGSLRYPNGKDNEVKDDLLTHVRKGSFK